MSKKFKNETSSLFSIITVLVVLAIIGIFSQSFWHHRFDLTEDKQFTLSNAAVKTLRNLPDLITIKVVMSTELPTQFVQIKTHIKDLLEEFRARADGKLELTYMDPGSDEEKKKQARSMGIQEVQMQEQSQGGLEIKKGFFGLAITYGDKKEVIPILNNVQTFEYDLIVKIKKLTGDVKTLGIVEGSEGSKFSFAVPGPQPQTLVGFEQNFGALKSNLEKLYTVKMIDITTKVDDKVDLILVAAPKKLTDRECFWLDQALMKGKSVLFMSPGVEVNLGYGIQGTPTNNGYEKLLSHYGVSVKKDIVAEDRSFKFVPFGNSIFPIPYPYWIVVGQNQMDEESAITSKIGQMSFPWASSLSIDSTKLDSSNSLIILANSTNGSWQESGRFNLMPRDLKEFLPINQKPVPLVAQMMGQFTSYYEKNALPTDSGFTTLGPVLKQTEADAMMLVIPNVMFVADFYVNLMRASSNVNFVLNAVDQMALDPDLIKIRSRNIASRPIPEEKKNSKLTYVTANMIISPIILLIIGILVGLRRRKRDAST
ncbi:MAG: GldG family protein [Fibrobacteria bacterium]|nr:GldG family protein [Fibrobacteria bacterium]